VDIFDADKLEKILIANWTHFIDSSKLMAYAQKQVQENASHLEIISGEQIKNKGVRITISRFYYSPNGFLIWIEFNAPIAPKNNYAEGTLEVLLNHHGQLKLININGHIN
jgi:hypothetical protein